MTPTREELLKLCDDVMACRISGMQLAMAVRDYIENERLLSPKGELSATHSAENEAEARLDAMMADAFMANDAPMIDYAIMKFKIKRLERELNTRTEQHVPEGYVLIKVEDCPNPGCRNDGFYPDGDTEQPDQVQCEFCYTTPNSRYNIGHLVATNPTSTMTGDE